MLFNLFNRDKDVNFDDAPMDDGFDDTLDFDDGFDDFDEGGRKPIEEFAESAFDAAKNEALTVNNQKRFIETALPDGYKVAHEGLVDTYDFANDLYQNVRQDLKPAEKAAKRLVGRFGHQLEGVLPTGITDRMKEIGAQEEQNQVSKAQAEEQTINESLASIFDANRKSDAITAEQTAVREHIKEVKEDARFDTTATLLNRIRAVSEKQLAYQDSVMINYQKKSLELQYKQYFLQRDHLTLHEAYVKDTKDKLSAIVKNTALPDFLKLEMSEAAQEHLRNKLIGYASDKGHMTLRKFAAQKALEWRNEAQKLNMTAEQINDAAESMASGEVGTMDLIGGMVGGVVTNEATGVLGMLVNELYEGDERVEHIGRMLEHYNEDPRRAINEIVTTLQNDIDDRRARDYEKAMDPDERAEIDKETKERKDLLAQFERGYASAKKSIFKGVDNAMEKVLNIGGEFGQFRNTQDLSVGVRMNDLVGKQGIYSALTDKTIREVIPGIMREQLQELEMIRTGRNDIERKHWDHDTDSLIRESVTHRKIQDEVASDDRIKNVKKTTTDLLNWFGADRLSGDAQIILRDYTEDKLLNNETFDPLNIARDGVGSNIHKGRTEAAKELQDFIKSQHVTLNPEDGEIADGGYSSDQSLALREEGGFDELLSKALAAHRGAYDIRSQLNARYGMNAVINALDGRFGSSIRIPDDMLADMQKEWDEHVKDMSSDEKDRYRIDNPRPTQNTTVAQLDPAAILDLMYGRKDKTEALPELAASGPRSLRDGALHDDRFRTMSVSDVDVFAELNDNLPSIDDSLVAIYATLDERLSKDPDAKVDDLVKRVGDVVDKLSDVDRTLDDRIAVKLDTIRKVMAKSFGRVKPPSGGVSEAKKKEISRAKKALQEKAAIAAEDKVYRNDVIGRLEMIGDRINNGSHGSDTTWFIKHGNDLMLGFQHHFEQYAEQATDLLAKIRDCVCNTAGAMGRLDEQLKEDGLFGRMADSIDRSSETLDKIYKLLGGKGGPSDGSPPPPPTPPGMRSDAERIESARSSIKEIADRRPKDDDFTTAQLIESNVVQAKFGKGPKPGGSGPKGGGGGPAGTAPVNKDGKVSDLDSYRPPEPAPFDETNWERIPAAMAVGGMSEGDIWENKETGQRLFGDANGPFDRSAIMAKGGGGSGGNITNTGNISNVSSFNGVNTGYGGNFGGTNYGPSQPQQSAEVHSFEAKKAEKDATKAAAGKVEMPKPEDKEKPKSEYEEVGEEVLAAGKLIFEAMLAAGDKPKDALVESTKATLEELEGKPKSKLNGPQTKIGKFFGDVAVGVVRTGKKIDHAVREESTAARDWFDSKYDGDSELKQDIGSLVSVLDKLVNAAVGTKNVASSSIDAYMEGKDFSAEHAAEAYIAKLKDKGVELPPEDEAKVLNLVKRLDKGAHSARESFDGAKKAATDMYTARKKNFLRYWDNDAKKARIEIATTVGRNTELAYVANKLGIDRQAMVDAITKAAMTGDELDTSQFLKGGDKSQLAELEVKLKAKFDEYGSKAAANKDVALKQVKDLTNDIVKVVSDENVSLTDMGNMVKDKAHETVTAMVGTAPKVDEFVGPQLPDYPSIDVNVSPVESSAPSSVVPAGLFTGTTPVASMVPAAKEKPPEPIAPPVDYDAVGKDTMALLSGSPAEQSYSAKHTYGVGLQQPKYGDAKVTYYTGEEEKEEEGPKEMSLKESATEILGWIKKAVIKDKNAEPEEKWKESYVGERFWNTFGKPYMDKDDNLIERNMYSPVDYKGTHISKKAMPKKMKMSDARANVVPNDDPVEQPFHYRMAQSIGIPWVAKDTYQPGEVVKPFFAGIKEAFTEIYDKDAKEYDKDADRWEARVEGKKRAEAREKLLESGVAPVHARTLNPDLVAVGAGGGGKGSGSGVGYLAIDPESDSGYDWLEHLKSFMYRQTTRITDAIDEIDLSGGQFRGLMNILFGRDSTTKGPGDIVAKGNKWNVFGKRKAILSEKGIMRGEYTDVNTGKIIDTIEDITGPVTDTEGKVVLTQTQFDQGLDSRRSGKKKKGLVGTAIDTVTTPFKMVNAMWGGVTGSIAAAGRNAKDFVGRQTKGLLFGDDTDKHAVVDIYLKGQPEMPLLLARDLARGRYIDEESKLPVRTISDIRGNVLDISSDPVTIAVTKDDLAKDRLYTRAGKRTVGGVVHSMIKNTVGFTFEKMADLAALPRKAYNAVFKKNLSVYKKGEFTPTLTSQGLESGRYVDAVTREKIRSKEDITENGVIDLTTGEVVISKQDVYNGLTDFRGKMVVGGQKIVSGTVGAIGSGAKALWNVNKTWLKMLGKVGGFAANFMKGGLKGAFGDSIEMDSQFRNMLLETSLAQTTIQHEIFSLLDKRLGMSPNAPAEPAEVVEEYEEAKEEASGEKKQEDSDKPRTGETAKEYLDRRIAEDKANSGFTQVGKNKIDKESLEPTQKQEKQDDLAEKREAYRAKAKEEAIAAGINPEDPWAGPNAKRRGPQTAKPSEDAKPATDKPQTEEAKGMAGAANDTNYDDPNTGKKPGFFKGLAGVVIGGVTAGVSGLFAKDENNPWNPKEPKEETQSAYDKINDIDGDGHRNNGWREKLFGKKEEAAPTQTVVQGVQAEKKDDDPGFFATIMGIAVANIIANKLTEFIETVGKKLLRIFGFLKDADGVDIDLPDLDGPDDDGKDKKKGDGKDGKDGKKGGKKGKLARAWDWTKDKASSLYEKAANTKAGKAIARKGGSILAKAGATALGRKAIALGGAAAAGAAIVGGGTAAAIGAAVVGTGMVAYDIYDTWSELNNTSSGELEMIRMNQYGFDDGDDSVGITYRAEEYLQNGFTFDENGAHRTIYNDPRDPVLKAFNVDWEDEEDMARFAPWYYNVFLPVYGRHRNILAEIRPDVNLHDIDAKLTDEEKYLFLTKLRGKDLNLKEAKEYPFDDPGFDDGYSMPPGNASEAVTSYMNTLSEKLDPTKVMEIKANHAPAATKDSSVALGGASVPVNASVSTKKEVTDESGKKTFVAENKTVLDKESSRGKEDDADFSNSFVEDWTHDYAGSTFENVVTKGGAAAAGITTMAATSLSGPGALFAGGGAAYGTYKALGSKNHIHGPFIKIRMLDYGFTDLRQDKEAISRIRAAEERLIKRIAISGGTATVDVDPKEALAAFGLGREDFKTKKEFDFFTQWYADRFLPVFLAHYLVLRTLNPDETFDRVDFYLSHNTGKIEPYYRETKLSAGRASAYSVSVNPFKPTENLVYSSVKAVEEGRDKIYREEIAPLMEGADVLTNMTKADLSINMVEDKDLKSKGGISYSVSEAQETMEPRNYEGDFTVFDKFRYGMYGLSEEDMANKQKLGAVQALENEIAAKNYHSTDIQDHEVNMLWNRHHKAFGLDKDNKEQEMRWKHWLANRMYVGNAKYRDVMSTTGIDKQGDGSYPDPTGHDAEYVLRRMARPLTRSGISVWDAPLTPWVGGVPMNNTQGIELREEALEKSDEVAVMSSYSAPPSQNRPQPQQMQRTASDDVGVKHRDNVEKVKVEEDKVAEPANPGNVPAPDFSKKSSVKKPDVPHIAPVASPPPPDFGGGSPSPVVTAPVSEVRHDSAMERTVVKQETIAREVAVSRQSEVNRMDKRTEDYRRSVVKLLGDGVSAQHETTKAVNSLGERLDGLSKILNKAVAVNAAESENGSSGVQRHGSQHVMDGESTAIRPYPMPIDMGKRFVS